MKESTEILKVRNLSKSYNGRDVALNDVSFTLEKGKVLSVIGNSGGGKSTLLKLLAGFEKPDSGCVFKSGFEISSMDKVQNAGKRGIGMIFQDFALFPHLTVDGNVRFGFEVNKKKGRLTIAELYELCGLKGLERRYPHELSGGQQQKVALARSLAAAPDILLMDEPFGSIDVINKQALRQELLTVLHQTGTTAIIVSHDYRDVMELADEVLVLQDGRMTQTGSVEELYNRPVSAYVARLFGDCNVLKGQLNGQVFETAFGNLPVDDRLHFMGTEVFIRPEKLNVTEGGGLLNGTISGRRFSGQGFRYRLSNAKQELLFDSARADLSIGSVIELSLT